MKNCIRFVAGIALLSLLAACESTHKVKEPTMSGLALQQLQTREFEAPLKVVFASVISVFQDTGYIVDSADTDTGFITAKSPSDSSTTYDLLWGFGKKHKSTMVTAFVEPLGQDFTKVRLNFVAINQSNKMYGISSRVDTPIEDTKIYENVFEKIDETVFIRLAINQNAAPNAAGEVPGSPTSDDQLEPSGNEADQPIDEATEEVTGIEGAGAAGSQ